MCESQSNMKQWLFVGNIEPTVNEERLRRHFGTHSTPKSIIINKRERRTSHAFVEFASQDEAMSCMERFNFTPLNGLPLRIMERHDDSSLRDSGRGNVIVKNIPENFEEKDLKENFLQFGQILSVKIARNELGKPKGYGFVHLKNVEEAERCVSTMNGTSLNGQRIRVEHFIPRENRPGQEGFKNLFVKNLYSWVTENDLISLFSQYGQLTSVCLKKDANGCSKGFGFVSFARHDDALLAMSCLNGLIFYGKMLYVAEALTKSAHAKQLLSTQGRLFFVILVENIDETCTENKLKEIFANCDSFIDAKLTPHPDKAVVFFNAKAGALRAVLDKDGSLIGEKEIKCTLASYKNGQLKTLTSSNKGDPNREARSYNWQIKITSLHPFTYQVSIPESQNTE